MGEVVCHRLDDGAVHLHPSGAVEEDDRATPYSLLQCRELGA